MSAEMSLEVIKLTQENLGKFIKKPPLTEKLLKKPPFRFLHDIVTTIIRTTGFFEGLFSEDELVSDNVKDRDSKIAFLQKIIEVVNIVTESSLSVRPSKVIAGLEPEKTNELLLKISYALQQNLSSKQAVETVASSKNTKSSTESKPPKVKSKTEKEPNNKPTKTSKPEVTSKQKPTSLLSDRKGVKEKSKTESNNTLEKSTLRSKRTEPTKKIKPNEPAAKGLRPGGDSKKQDKNKIENTAKIIKNPFDIDNEDEGNNHQSVLGNVVELKDILDSDEGTENDPGKSFDLSEPTAQEVSLISQDEVIKEANETIDRPQSRIHRKPSAREHKSEVLNGNSDVKPLEAPLESVKDSQFGENITLKDDENKLNSEEAEQNDSISEPVEIKRPIIRTASSRRSAKIKPEILKSAQSISIESRSDADLLDQSKSLSSTDSENRVQPRPRTSLRPPSVRPSSARPGAPRLKERNTDVIITTAEPVLIGKVNVIVENYDNQPEDDEGSVEVMQITADDNISISGGGDSKTDINASGHGHLVQQILETQKELANEDAPKVEIEWEWGARKEREASYKEVESIRGGLQSLSRASNPLGKLMDYVQEDVEVMRQELIQWRDARLSAATQLKQQQSLTEQQVQPLLAKLKQLEDSIVEQTESIHTVKSNIHRNTLKILKLIDGDD